jgi:hypothetical protein
MYFDNFGNNVTKAEIGRNALNEEQGPQLLDMPGFALGIFP